MIFMKTNWNLVDTNKTDGQGGLACCDSWGRKQLDTTDN